MGQSSVDSQILLFKIKTCGEPDTLTSISNLREAIAPSASGVDVLSPPVWFTTTSTSVCTLTVQSLFVESERLLAAGERGRWLRNELMDGERFLRPRDSHEDRAFLTIRVY